MRAGELIKLCVKVVVPIQHVNNFFSVWFQNHGIIKSLCVFDRVKRADKTVQ